MSENKNIFPKAFKAPLTGAYITQPISQPDERAPDSQIAMPDEQNVDLNRDWIIENKL